MRRWWVGVVGLVVAVAAAQGEVLRGQVVNADGQAVAGAKVYMVLRGSGPQPPLAPLTSADDGRFSVELGPSPARSQYCEAVALLPGRGVAVGAAGVTQPLRLVLQPVASTSGRLVDGDGRPAAGVRVTVFWLRVPVDKGQRIAMLPTVPPGPPWEVVTDAAGHWVFDCLPAQGGARLLVADARFAHERLDVAGGTDAAKPTTLRPGGCLSGCVRYGGGAPAPGVRVLAQGCGDTDSWDSTRTDAAGRYTLIGLEAGPVNVMVDTRGLAWTAAARERVVPVPGRTLPDIDLTLIKGLMVTGTTVDADSGQPLANVEVGCYGPHRPDSSAMIDSTRSDAEGRFQLRVPPGRSRVYVCGTLPDYPHSGNNQVNVTVQADVTPDPVKLTLKRGLSISGTVLDEHGRPVPQAVVAVGEPAWGDPSAVTDAQGQFTLRGLRRDRPVSLHAHRADGTAQARLTVPVGPKDVTGLRLVLQPVELTTLRGKVVDERHQPLAGATVSMAFMRPREPADPWASRPPLVTQTDAQGAYHFDQAPSDWLVSVGAQRPGYRTVRGGAVLGTPPRLVAEDLVLETLGARVALRVTDPAGQAVAGATVYAAGYCGSQRVLTAAEGRVTLGDLPAKPLTLYALAGRRAVGSARWDGAATQLTLVVTEPPAPDWSGTPTEAAQEQALALLDEAWKVGEQESWGRETLLTQMARLDPVAALEHADLLPAAQHDAGLAAALLPLEAEAALPLLPEVKRIKAPGLRASVAARLGRRLVAGHRDAASELCRLALADPLEAKDGRVLQTAVELTALAGALGRPDAADLERRALATLRACSPAEATGRLAYLAATLPDDLPLLDRLLAALGVAPADTLFVAATFVIVEAQRDPTKALARFQRVFGGQPLREVLTPGPQAGLSRVERNAVRAAVQLAPALAPADPTAALALARGLEPVSDRAQTLAAVARRLPANAARPLFVEAARVARQAARMDLARVAAAAQDSAPELAAAWLDEVLANVTAFRPGSDSYGRAELAFCLVRSHPNAARWLLECEVADADGDARQTGESDPSAVGCALAALDATRATALARSLPVAADRATLLLHAAQWLSATGPARRDLNFRRWSQAPSYRPGDPILW